MFCKNCGTQLPDDASFCFNCGKPQQPPNPPEEAITHLQQNDIVCPVRRHRDAIQKLSSLVASGTVDTSMSGSGVGVSVPVGKGSSAVTVAGASLGGTTVSHLAKDLAAPPKPTLQEPTILAMAIGLLALCGLVYISMLTPSLGSSQSGTYAIFAALVGVIVLGPLLGYAKIRGRRIENVSAEMPKWEIAMQKWNRLYYCYRDDVVFDPNEGTAIPRDQIKNYIYRETPRSDNAAQPDNQ